MPERGRLSRSQPGGEAMRLRGRGAVIGATIVVLSSLVMGGAVATSRASGEAAALQPTGTAAAPGIEARVNKLLGQMTVDEKLQQLELLSDGQITDADARAGVGSVFSLTDPAKINHFQQVAVKESRLHIRSCSPTTRSTATARSSRSPWAPRAASTRRWSPPTTPSLLVS